MFLLADYFCCQVEDIFEYVPDPEKESERE
jgi:hypothetical protein